MPNPSRRDLLFLLALSPEALDALQQHAHAPTAPPKLQYLDPQTAADLEALAAQIIPSDDTPGAKEAGVIFFIDRALATFDQDKRALYRDGLAAARAAARAAGLSAAKIEHTEFFETLRRHTIMGFLASPAWGGNRG